MHILMARGAAEFEALFPGLLDDMVSAGVLKLENRPDCIYFGAAGHVLGTGHTLRREFTAYVPSRKQLEWQIRSRAAALRNVRIARCDVDAPGSTARRNGSPVCCWPAATGRSSRRPTSSSTRAAVAPGCRPGWSSGDTQRPPEETVDVGISYATQQLRIPDGLLAEKVVVAGRPAPNRSAWACCATRTAPGR